LGGRSGLGGQLFRVASRCGKRSEGGRRGKGYRKVGGGWLGDK